MISQGEVKRRYAKLMQSVANDSYYKVDLTNRVNCYSCDCGHITKTKDVDAGVTPMFFSCEKCDASAVSAGYRDIAPQQEPTIEWYRPTLLQLLKMRNKPAMIEHVLNGGLEFRAIPQPSPVTKS